MSLYTFSHSGKITSVKIPAGLRMEKSTEIRMLSIIGNSTNKDWHKTGKYKNGRSRIK